MGKKNLWKTRTLQIGALSLGGDAPIRIQSMTTTPTENIQQTISQIIELSDLGCEIIRVAVQGKKEAFACEAIKNTLLKKNYQIPLVADIHYSPSAALIAVEFVDKIRINPGNFSTENNLESSLFPLLDKCIQGKKVLRLGVNHGSLSTRILEKFGNTPKGMLESALEYLSLCQRQNFHDLVFSFKASDPRTMIQAYRLFVLEMLKRNESYPLHLGVTEAGNGLFGIVKSTVGIGALLSNGIGDTIRVSLTEDPQKEIFPAKTLASLGSTFRNVPFDPSLWLFDPPERARPKGTVFFSLEETKTPYALLIQEPVVFEKLSSLSPQRIFFQGDVKRSFQEKLEDCKQFFQWNHIHKNVPIIWVFDGSQLRDEETFAIHSAFFLGSLFCDFLGEGLLLLGKQNAKIREDLSLFILQACKILFTKTEWISCPGCGRTLYDIQTVLKTLQEKLPNLPGTKLAVMGCHVNGLGEMGDADFGCVGSNPGKVDLYVGKTCVEKHVDPMEVTSKLLELIKAFHKENFS